MTGPTPPDPREGATPPGDPLPAPAAPPVTAPPRRVPSMQLRRESAPSPAPVLLRKLLIPAAACIATGWAITWQLSDASRLKDERRAELQGLEVDSTRLREASAAQRHVTDSLAAFLEGRAARDSAANLPYLVISIADNRLWYRRGNEVLFETRVATGSGKFLEKQGTTGEQWKFETPRGRLVVQRKDIDPAWVPPDWHYVEMAQKRGLKLLRLDATMQVPTSNGGVVTVSGSNVVTRFADGREVPFEASDGREIAVGDQLIVPPFGTNQRRYMGVLGANRLYLGDGYGIHGTDSPTSIGRSVSHGCIRVRNEDIETLFRIVTVGTPVYVY